MLMGATGFLFGWQIAEGILGLDRVVALVPASFCGLLLGVVCIICEYRRKPDSREKQEVYVSSERYDD